MIVKSEVKKSRKIFTQIHPMSHLQQCAPLPPPLPPSLPPPPLPPITITNNLPILNLTNISFYLLSLHTIRHIRHTLRKIIIPNSAFLFAIQKSKTYMLYVSLYYYISRFDYVEVYFLIESGDERPCHWSRNSWSKFRSIFCHWVGF